MRTVVVGAGVVGVTTAYALARKGHTVTVIERQPSTAMESSFANGGQLSFGFASPMASPDILKKAPSILLGQDRAFTLPWRFLLREPAWLLRFTRACLPSAYQRHAKALSELAAASKDALDRLCDETGARFSRRQSGKLTIYDSVQALDRIAAQLPNVSAATVLDRDACLALDPALAHIAGQLAGGVWFEQDEIGDVERFCHQVAKQCTQLFGTQFRFNLNVDTAQCKTGDGLTLRLSDGSSMDCDAMVICTGSAGQRLLKHHHIQLPIVPVVGYSITAPLGMEPPQVAITDARHKVVCSRIGDYIRIAGFADFGPPDEATRRDRIDALLHLARQRFPAAADFYHLHSTWTGIRPATPSSLPIVGATNVPGVYLNMGHGMYGWTLAPATAERLATAIQPPAHRNAA